MKLLSSDIDDFENGVLIMLTFRWKQMLQIKISLQSVPVLSTAATVPSVVPIVPVLRR